MKLENVERRRLDSLNLRVLDSKLSQFLPSHRLQTSYPRPVDEDFWFREIKAFGCEHAFVQHEVCDLVEGSIEGCGAENFFVCCELPDSFGYEVDFELTLQSFLGQNDALEIFEGNFWKVPANPIQRLLFQQAVTVRILEVLVSTLNNERIYAIRTLEEALRNRQPGSAA